ncbi:MAG TPA: alpha/beta fold hydrolase [Povalibacter sp.]|uniref:alpha/beta fold hydrolase n=1 Tax=Povalibacter sp. TaxID=1962978 RepID=UPI002CDEB2CF|nr:alpha/beta fold hydrolase [Povalibacter sp.]HMN42992.1 alpha/beta fold hydrolase [Povalibacter sp.]
MIIAQRGCPLYFGDPERPLFGWLHQPAEQRASIGLVICSPTGYEAVCARRAIKHLASDAARAGIPALRFDYDGTGDSAGTDLDDNRLRSWTKSIEMAIDALRSHSGVQRVCLLGIRLGATLATLVASKRSDIDALIGVAPIVNVRTYLRELRALSLARPRTSPPDVTDGDVLEAAGFEMTLQTREALLAVDLMKESPPPSLRVLIIERDDMPSNDAWPRHLQAAGVNVESLRPPGYAAMMLDSHEAQLPTRIIATVTEWIMRLAGPTATILDGRSKPLRTRASFESPSASSSARVHESAQFLDEQCTLFGIVSDAENAPAEHPTPLVLLLNAGAVHHIGPNRLYVTLARRLAARGVRVLRMDLSGLGDSAVAEGYIDNDVYTPRAEQDIRTAIARMQQLYGASEVHAVGLCSGAYHGFKAAVAGVQLRSVVAINPLTFHWISGMSLAIPEYRVASQMRHYRKMLLEWELWKRLLTGNVDLGEVMHILQRRIKAASYNVLREIARAARISLPRDLGSELLRIARQNTDVLFVFAQNEPGLDLLQGGAGSVLNRLQRRELVQVVVLQQSDHTFTTHWSRKNLLEVLTAHTLSYACPKGVTAAHPLTTSTNGT